MEYYSIKFLIWAVVLGALSAVSLPLGSVIGLRTNPRPTYISILAAFGAGALLAALSIELVAPTVTALHEGSGKGHGSNVLTDFYSLVIGLILGGLVYYVISPRGLSGVLADPFRAVFYLLIFIGLCITLGRVWVEVSGLAPRDIAGQIIDSQMQVPGFRSSEKILERILKRYIPTLVILNGILIAVLSFFADSLGALTSGTGLLISIGIIHQYGETLAKEMAASQYPGLRGLLGMD